MHLTQELTIKIALASLLLAGLFACLLSACSSLSITDSAGNTVRVLGTKKIADFAYGNHPRQRMDIYAPDNTKNAPVIMMLYGAGYYPGDKTSPAIYVNKLKRWGLNGFIVISINTRNLPESDAYTQAQDLALAVATAQQHAAEWGGDPNKFFLMGHSSGGHLVSLLGANPGLVTSLGGKRWLAGVALDASSLDIPLTMSTWHADFLIPLLVKIPQNGHPPRHITNLARTLFHYWRLVHYNGEIIPVKKAQQFAEKAKDFGVNVQVLPLNLNHGEVNDFLGLPGDYTSKVEHFMANTHPDVAHMLGIKSNQT